MSFKGRKKALFSTSSDVVAPFFCNVSKSVLHYIVTQFGAMLWNIKIKLAEMMPVHCFVICFSLDCTRFRFLWLEK